MFKLLKKEFRLAVLKFTSLQFLSTTLFAQKFFLQKPYRCCVDGCNKAYTDPSSLRKHIKRHHSDDTYENLKKNKVLYRSRMNMIQEESNITVPPAPSCLIQKPALNEISNFPPNSWSALFVTYL